MINLRDAAGYAQFEGLNRHMRRKLDMARLYNNIIYE